MQDVDTYADDRDAAARNLPARHVVDIRVFFVIASRRSDGSEPGRLGPVAEARNEAHAPQRPSDVGSGAPSDFGCSLGHRPAAASYTVASDTVASARPFSEHVDSNFSCAGRSRGKGFAAP